MTLSPSPEETLLSSTTINPSPSAPTQAVSRAPDKRTVVSKLEKEAKEEGLNTSSFGIIQGQRSQILPFEVHVQKGLFGLGVTLAADPDGSVIIRSIAPNTAIGKEGNLR